jgi:hypothetical protein
LIESLLGVACQLDDGVPRFQQLLFGLAHQLDKDFALPSALAAKAPHDLV